MTLENQVVSLDLAKRLKELGVKQESLFYWVNQPNGGLRTNGYKWQLEPEPRTRHQSYDYISAFTVAELGEMLGRESNSIMFAEGKWACVAEPLFELTESDTEANTRAKMLIYLLENNLISVK